MHECLCICAYAYMIETESLLTFIRVHMTDPRLFAAIMTCMNNAHEMYIHICDLRLFAAFMT
jgi:hypothetical protein